MLYFKFFNWIQPYSCIDQYNKKNVIFLKQN